MDLTEPRYWKLLVNQSLLRFFLLQALSEKEIHGYGLQSVLTVISNGLCKPSQGTLYPALKELEQNGYVKGKWLKVKNRKRKVYLLTTRGESALETASEVLQKALVAFSPKEKELPPLPFEKEIEEEKEPKLPMKF